MEEEIWQVYQNQSVQVIGLDIWNGTNSQVQNYAEGAGRNITFPLGIQAAQVGNQYGLDRHSFVLVDAQGAIQYITPQSTPYTQRYERHKEEMMAKIEELISITSVEPRDRTPETFTLFQNAPNPFSETTQLAFELGADGQNQPIKITVYDILGRAVRTVISGRFSAGKHTVNWDGRNERGQRVPAGVYFYVLQSGPTRLVKRLIFVPN